MDLLKEIFHPDFLSKNSLYVNFIVGFSAPLIGGFLVLRRMVFMGVALPSISSAGIALALSLHVWFGHYEGGHGEQEQEIALAGSLVFTLAAILWLAFQEKREKGFREGRIGLLYVLATAGSLLLLAKCPAAERGWLNLFKGEIVATNDLDFWITASSLFLVVGLLLIFRRDFLLVSFDPEMAVTLKRSVLGWNLFLYFLIGLAIAVSVMTVGPLITFGFMVIPPLIAHRLAANMRQFFVWASLAGGTAAGFGFFMAYKWDLPIGPTDVSLLGAAYLLSLFFRRG